MRTVLETVGNSPLIRLANLLKPNDAEILLKMERTNPGEALKIVQLFSLLRKPNVEDG